MITGGRILHHMSQWLGKEETTVVFVGYQAEGTRGRTIQSGAEEVKIFGDYIPIKAHVETISGLSAHADYSELIRWLKSSQGSPFHVKVIHGEPNSAEAFKEKLEEKFDWKASVAEFGETVEV
jgi:metallo-beta-lactamase family protein